MMAEVFKSTDARLTAGVITPFQVNLEPKVCRHWIYKLRASLNLYIV